MSRCLNIEEEMGNTNSIKDIVIAGERVLRFGFWFGVFFPPKLNIQVNVLIKLICLILPK